MIGHPGIVVDYPIRPSEKRPIKRNVVAHVNYRDRTAVVRAASTLSPGQRVYLPKSLPTDLGLPDSVSWFWEETVEGFSYGRGQSWELPAWSDWNVIVLLLDFVEVAGQRKEAYEVPWVGYGLIREVAGFEFTWEKALETPARA